MRIDGYEIKFSLDMKEKIWLITYLMPIELDKGVSDQIRANVYGYVDDNIPLF